MDTRHVGHAIVLNGASLAAEPSGALWWGDEGTLVVADLHLEKGSSFAQGGVMLPPYDTIATLERLARSMRAELRRVICLGDSFHDRDGPLRLAAGDAARLAALTRSREWIWIAGNHDPDLPQAIGGRMVADELRIGPLVFRHIAAARQERGEVSGHYHPKAGVTLRGRRFGGPCFLYDGARLVLPAFGAFTGGLDAAAPELRALFPGGASAALIARGRIIALDLCGALPSELPRPAE
ncbi:MAG TPA: ligase-associated DNA damage response endonuclease PdeM [Stellaceae bacterium]|nr:ligase-associated DNA damage response endonuclease PdeM [Stellaceae bacterium]